MESNKKKPIGGMGAQGKSVSTRADRITTEMVPTYDMADLEKKSPEELDAILKHMD